MKISIDWLSTYIEFDLPLSRIIDALNNIGMLVDSWEEVEGDVILDIETYANRPDTLGHLGMARELAAALNLPIKKPSWPLIESSEKTSGG